MKKIVAFIAVMCFVLLMFGSNYSNITSYAQIQPKEEALVLDYVKKLATVKAADVENYIREQERIYLQRQSEELKKRKIEETLLKLQKGQISLRKVFADTCFVGDSLLHGLEVYNILNADRLITQISARLSHLEENLDEIISQNPDNLVLHYGLNMLWDSETGTQWFIDDYSEIIVKLKKALPNTRIIISSIFPVDTDIATEEIFTHIPRHNEAIKQMCADLDVEFLDSTALVDSSKEYYSTDGIHLYGSFYSEKWLPYIVENKGITG